MTVVERINDDYFKWLCEQIDSRRFSKYVSYDKLLAHLHNIEFTWCMLMDENRADDGIQLRRRYSLYNGDVTLSDYITGPCSVLEMMAALAIRCEESTMDDTQMGNRTGQWFWGMIHNLGLTPMTNPNFDRQFVDDVIARFLNREYAPNGKGGLFTVKNRDDDLRTVEIWRQLSWYLDSFM